MSLKRDMLATEETAQGGPDSLQRGCWEQSVLQDDFRCETSNSLLHANGPVKGQWESRALLGNATARGACQEKASPKQAI